MKRVFNRFALNAAVFFLAITAISVTQARAAEFGKKYKNQTVFVCQTRAGAKLARDHMQSTADVARNERIKPLPVPKDANCGYATAVTLEVVGYADELLNGEGVDKDGNITKERFLIVNISEPFTLNGAFIKVSISTTIKGIDPPEKRAGAITLPATLLSAPKAPGQLNGADQSSGSATKQTKAPSRVAPTSGNSVRGNSIPSR